MANLDPSMKISWCYDPCQRSSERGWRILIPQQGKFMFLLSSTYKSEGVANFDPFMKISWGYGLDPLDHSPIPYQAPENDDDDADDADDDDDDDDLEVWSNVGVGGNMLKQQ